MASTMPNAIAPAISQAGRPPGAAAAGRCGCREKRRQHRRAPESGCAWASVPHRLPMRESA